jgi:uncharacterized protein (TIGR00251 family)
MLQIREEDGSVTFEVRVIPRASRTGVAGEIGGILKLRIAAPPVDGKANEECRRFLADVLGVARGRIEIISGAASRNKVVRIKGVTAEQIMKALAGS